MALTLLPNLYAELPVYPGPWPNGKVGSCSATDVQVLNRVCVECALLPATPLVTRDGPTPITADATQRRPSPSSSTPTSRRASG